MRFSWEKVRFESRGLQLAGLLYTSSPPPACLVVICHGFQGTKEGNGRALEMAEALGERGYASFLFDFAGRGESEGDFADLTLSNQVADLGSALAYVRGRGFEKVVVNGRSFGGTTAVCRAAFDPFIAGVCTWAAPAEPLRLFRALREKYRGASPEEKVPLGDGSYLKYQFFLDLEKHQPLAAAAKLAPRPFLIIHGEKDEVVPPRDAELFWGAAGEPKELVKLPGADHQFTSAYREAWEAFFSWLARYFPLEA